MTVDEELKYEVCRMVHANPGISSDEIAKRLNKKKYDVILILAELEDEGKIRTV